jgi:hypothetical protein
MLLGLAGCNGGTSSSGSGVARKTVQTAVYRSLAATSYELHQAERNDGGPNREPPGVGRPDKVLRDESTSACRTLLVYTGRHGYTAEPDGTI